MASTKIGEPVVLLSFVLIFLTRTISQEMNFDDVPGVAMEYRVHVDAGKEDCYYQYVHPGASLFISFWVSSNLRMCRSVYFSERILFDCLKSDLGNTWR